MFKVCVLASGSSGNATLVRTSRTTILVDAGLSHADLTRRLGSLGLSLEAVDAILIGHEHGDHTRGLGVINRRWQGPIFMNRATSEAVGEKFPQLNVTTFENHQSWEVGDIKVSPFPVQHDAADPVGFVIESTGCKVAAATDLGVVTRVVREAFRGANIAIIEANYDRDLLLDGPRPWHLKQRIAGNRGHLDNSSTGELLAEVGGESLSDVFLAHLSRDCNIPERALETVREHLARAGKEHVRVHLTRQDRPSPEVEIKMDLMLETSEAREGGQSF